MQDIMNHRYCEVQFNWHSKLTISLIQYGERYIVISVVMSVVC